ncbi:MAG: DUF3352 domain-containing protein [Microcystis aeruginosa Ma_AC_P_19900807_S299]|nr:MAG: DUF3352 domain-containing protein [Microcystis aeruginosa Ma_AC_P_19900807_S299]
MKLRSFFYLLGATVIILLGVATASFAWILADSPLSLLKGGVMREPTAAIFVPKQAPVMVSLLVNPERLESFGQLIATPANRRRSHQEIKDLEKSLLGKTGLNYQKEIKPWLGEEITLAVTSLDFDRDTDNGIQPGYLLAIQSKDGERAKEFLQASYSKQAVSGKFDLVFELYKGVNLASAVVGDTVLFANNIKVLREALNNVQVPDLNLKNSPDYREALKNITEPRIAIVYGNLPPLSAWIANQPVPESPEAKQRLATAFTLKSRGIVAQSENSLLVAASRDLNRFWTQVEEGLEADSPLQELITQVLNRFQSPLGLNLPEDVFSWVRGEYSLALVPSSKGMELDSVFVGERLMGVEVDSAIEHLDELARSRGYNVVNLPLLDRTVTAWTKLTTAVPEGKAQLETLVTGVHTRVDNYEIIASSVEAMGFALSAQKNPILSSGKFRQAITALPAENDGYFYVDWRQLQPVIEAKFPIVRVLELSIKPLFNNLRSLTISSQGSENSVRRGTIFFNLGVKS